jgi:hypothetical protein
MHRNRLNFAKLQILRYVDTFFICISDLVHPEIELAMNKASHGLNRDELVVVLHEMFENDLLVARKEGRGFFTPTLQEIESALYEVNDFGYRSANTSYGLTSAALEPLDELKRLYDQ